MPYIKQELRDIVDDDISDLMDTISWNIEPQNIDGVLNYCITKLISYFGENYVSLERGIGLLECAKLEFWDRKVRPFEDQAIIRNGDIE